MNRWGGPETQVPGQSKALYDPTERRSKLDCRAREALDQPRKKTPGPWSDPTLRMTLFSFLLLGVVLLVGVPLILFDRLPWEELRLGPWAVELGQTQAEGQERRLVTLRSRQAADAGLLKVLWEPRTLDLEVWADPANPSPVVLILPGEASGKALTLSWADERLIVDAAGASPYTQTQE